MTLIIDTAPLVALADARDKARHAVRAMLDAEAGELAVAAPVTAEVDYLLGQRLGRIPRLRFIADLAAGAFEVYDLTAGDYTSVLRIERKYADLDLGLADCATIVLAERLRTRRILTFDERHFRSVKPLQGGAFEILPADRT